MRVDHTRPEDEEIVETDLRYNVKDVIVLSATGLKRMLVSLPKFKFMEKPIDEEG